MSLSSCGTPHGGYQEVRPCSAQLVATYGHDGKCLHQEVIIHLLPSPAQITMTESFFTPLRSFGHGVMPTTGMNYPRKCSSVITSISVESDNPRMFRIGIRALYLQETNMKASEAAEALQGVADNLKLTIEKLEENDTYEVDIDRKVNLMTDLSEEINEYLEDQLS